MVGILDANVNKMTSKRDYHYSVQAVDTPFRPASRKTQKTQKTVYRILLIACVGVGIWLPIHILRKADSTNYTFGSVSKYLQSSQTQNIDTINQDTPLQEVVHQQQLDTSDPCHGFPNTDGIMLVMKTGATEAYQKMPTQLLTGMQCLPDFLLFSDLDQQIGQYHAYDVLSRVNDTVKATHQAFSLYRAQQDCPVSQSDCTQGMEGAWDLDKYKFLHMLVQAWEMRPNQKWYLFAEADTYIVWSNIVKWIHDRAPKDGQLYAGNVAMYGDFRFAHGGTGYLISGELLKRAVEADSDLGSVFDNGIENICCGDILVGKVIDALGVTLRNYWPMFNGDKPNTMAFVHRHWCQPVLTMHHVNSEEVNSIWQYEMSRRNDGPVLFKDIYEAFVEPHIAHRKQNWDNLSEGTCFHAPTSGFDDDRESSFERTAHESADACALACMAYGVHTGDRSVLGMSALEEAEYLRTAYRSKLERLSPEENLCFQWKYRQGECCLGQSIRLGLPDREENGRQWQSGWNKGGIQDWIQVKGQCADGPAWMKGECVGRHCKKMGLDEDGED